MSEKYDGITNVVKHSSHIGAGCKISGCNKLSSGANIDTIINHYINEHGYRILHIGTETNNDLGDELWHSTVVILGQ